jgi:HSP20 family molecular chaperone IbpA
MAQDQHSHQDVLDATRAAQSTMHPQKVPVNVYETEHAVVLVAPMPAVQPGQVQVELRGQLLRFYATLRSAPQRTYLHHEWDYGGYEREIEIPSGFGRELEAVLHNGQLVVRVLRGTPVGDRAIRPSSVLVLASQDASGAGTTSEEPVSSGSWRAGGS